MGDYSLNETASRLRLAAKGAGYSWGYADEICRAAYWLTSRSLPAPKMIAKLLQNIKAVTDLNQCMPRIQQLESSAGYCVESQGEWLCPIMLGATISDGVVLTSGKENVTAQKLKCPLLLLPFMVDLASRLNEVVSIRFDDYVVSVDETHIRMSSKEVLTLDQVSCVVISLQDDNAFEFNDDDHPTHSDRVNVEPATWQLLEELAHLTYAPATESSRLLGAGAGLQDND